MTSMTNNPADRLVLAVDDDPANLRLVSAWLEGAGYRVRTAANGVEALGLIEAECPDVLVTDWEMPKMDGLSLCRRIRGLNLPHYVYTLFLTNRHDTDDIIDALQAGADDFMTKPVGKGELLARILSGERIVDLERRLSAMARTDPLTGLPTRRTFFEQFQKEWKRAERYGLDLACAIFDIDFFKRINDTLGHAAGDDIIKRLAVLLEEGCRVSDTVCRYAGDEFCILLPETDEKGAEIWAERLRQRVSRTSFGLARGIQKVTCSIGVAGRHDNVNSPEDLIDLADQVLLVAKRSGRDRVVCHASVNEGVQRTGAWAGQGGVFRGITAREIMTPAATFLRHNDSIRAAVESMLDAGAGSAAVVDDAGRLVGVLSEKDLVNSMLWPDAWALPVSEAMCTNVVTYEEDSPA